MSTFLSLMLLLLAAITSPALENNFSDGTDIPQVPAQAPIYITWAKYRIGIAGNQVSILHEEVSVSIIVVSYRPALPYAWGWGRMVCCVCAVHVSACANMDVPLVLCKKVGSVRQSTVLLFGSVVDPSSLQIVPWTDHVLWMLVTTSPNNGYRTAIPETSWIPALCAWMYAWRCSFYSILIMYLLSTFRSSNLQFYKVMENRSIFLFSITL